MPWFWRALYSRRGIQAVRAKRVRESENRSTFVDPILSFAYLVGTMSCRFVLRKDKGGGVIRVAGTTKAKHTVLAQLM